MLKHERKSILIISPVFYPNMGGVEVHLEDLCEYLQKNGHKVFVITYQPLTERIKGPPYEKKGNLEIHRVRWFGYNWYPILEKKPLLVFAYLIPGLLLHSFAFMVLNRKKVDVVNAHGLVSSFIGALLKKMFKKRAVATVHTVYDLKKRPILGKIFAWILNANDYVLLCAQGALDELSLFNLDQTKSKVFTYWANQALFRPLDKSECKKRVGWNNKFVVLCIARLINIKGTQILVQAARKANKKINFAFIVTGTFKDFLRMHGLDKLPDNIIYVGKVDHSVLNVYYNAADILAVPSQYSEGFARVNIEAMLCGTPVIASKKGCLPEVIRSDVGDLIYPPTADEFAKRIEYYYNNPAVLKQLSQNCYEYARKRFSDENAKVVVMSYKAP